MKKQYVIVNEASNRPIFAMAFCNCYENKEEAIKAAENWNKRRDPSICKVKVIEKSI